MDILNNSNQYKREVSAYVDKVFLSIEYLPIEKVLYNNWMGYVTVNNVIAGAEASLEMLQKFDCSKLINDNRELVGRWTDANDWIENDWTPRAVSGGLRYFAHIVSPGVLAEASAINLQERVHGKFNMKLFSDVELAKDWLKSF